MTINGFVADPSFYIGDTTIISSSVENGSVGYPSDDILNYFVTPTRIKDVRTDRLTVLAAKAEDKISIHLDAASITDDSITTSSTAQFEALMNITELLYLSQNKTAVQLEAILVADTSTYLGYDPDSLSISSSTVNADVKLVNDTIDEDVPIRTWVSFSIVMGNDDTIKTFKLWLGNTAFKTDYPITNIVTIIPPCDPSKLISMDYSNIPTTLATSATYVNGLLSTAIAAKDHTGYLTYQAKYTNSSFGSYYNMPFGILYKGADPSSLELKIVVRDYLESLDVGDEATWKLLFPDLYTTSMFYIVPMWDNITSLPTRELYPSIFDYGSILEKTQAAITDLSDAHIEDKLEILNCSITEMIIAAVPHVDNDNPTTLLAEHPTYQAIDAQSLTFDYQTTLTREFNTKLSSCISVLDGGTSTTTFTSAVVDGNNWLTFIVNFIEYYVLYKEDFPSV